MDRVPVSRGAPAVGNLSRHRGRRELTPSPAAFQGVPPSEHQQWLVTALYRFLAPRLREAVRRIRPRPGGSAKKEESPQPPQPPPRPQRDEWMVMAFNEVWAELLRLEPCGGESCTPVLQYLEKQWLEGQINYHRGVAENAGDWSRFLENAGHATFLLAIGVAGLHIAALVFFRGHAPGLLNHPLTFLAIVLPAIGAALGGFRAHREFSRRSKRSENMAQDLEELKETLRSRVKNPAALADALREVEGKMLRETEDWLMLMEHVPVEPPG